MIDRHDQLAEKKIVDLYVHEIKVFSEKIDVVLRFDLGADKDGVGGGTWAKTLTTEMNLD